MSNDISGEVSAAAAKVSPAVMVAGAGAAGWGVQEWMYALTCLYLVAQLAYLLWKWRREYKAKREA